MNPRPILRVCLGCHRASTEQGAPWWPIADLALAMVGKSDDLKRQAVNAWAVLHGFAPSHGYCEDLCGPAEIEKAKEWSRKRKEMEADKTVPAHSPGKIYLKVGGKS